MNKGWLYRVRGHAGNAGQAWFAENEPMFMASMQSVALVE